MLTASAELATAIDLIDRDVDFQVRVEWPAASAAAYRDLTAWVKSISMSRSLTTDLPGAVKRATGVASATCTITLGGPGRGAVGSPLPTASETITLFSPWATTSPLYGAQQLGVVVTIDVGLFTYSGAGGPQRLRRFTGRTTNITVDATSGEVVIKAIDDSERLRGETLLPQVVGNDYYQGFGQRYNLNSSWVIDYLLRAAGVYSSPPVRDGVFGNGRYLATCHGSMWPEWGTPTAGEWWVDTDGDASVELQKSPPPFTTGNFGLAVWSGYTDRLAYAGFGGTFATSPNGSGPPLNTGAAGNNILMQFWVLRPAVNPADTNANAMIVYSPIVSGLQCQFAFGVGPALSWHPQVQMVIVSGGVAAATVTRNSTLTVPAGVWTYVAARIRWTSTSNVEVVFRVGATSETFGTNAVAVMDTAYRTATGISTFLRSPSQDIQVTYDNTLPEPVWDNAFTPAAVLDPGTNELTVMPITDKVIILDAIRDVADAEAATFIGYDEPGVFRFLNRYNRAVTASRTISPGAPSLNLKAWGWSLDMESVRNHVKVASSAYVVQPVGVAWQSDEPQRIPASSTATIWVSFDAPVVGLVTTIIKAPAGYSGPNSGYRAAKRADGGGGEVSNLAFTVTPFVKSAKVLVTNPNPYDVYLVNPPGYPTAQGVPSLTLRGRKVTSDGVTEPTSSTTAVQPDSATSTTADASWPASIALYGEQLLDISATPWRQRRTDAQTLADDLLADLYIPTIALADIAIRADPRLQLADRVRLADPDRTGVSDDIWLTRIEEELSAAAGYAMTVGARTVAPPGGWILGISTLGTNTNV